MGNDGEKENYVGQITSGPDQWHLVWYESKIVIPYYELQAGGCFSLER